MEVPDTLTPVAPAYMLDAIALAYVLDLGHPPSHETQATIYAQIALECANGRKIVQHNPGNYKRGPGPNWCTFATTEWIGTPPKECATSCEFSAWEDLPSALAYLIGALYTHWPEAWIGAVHGDPDEFARGLKLRGYFTAPLESYAAGMRAWYAYAMRRLQCEPGPEEPPYVMSPSGASVMAIDGLLDAPP